ncbi:MAG: sigma-54-dependent Fis family transcriptional regulator [Planctomycetes bacterium]|nr:sigma-54-dependent Fis family transcriptional regulator [Planctomycetota bacterium]
MRILLAEDEVTIAVTLTDALEGAGHEVVHVADTASALEQLASSKPECVITDIRMPGAGGMAVLARSKELDPARPVVLVTGFATVDQAVEAMRLGAANYVQKPFRNEAIVAMVETFARVKSLEDENAGLRRELAAAQGIEGVVGASLAMQQVFGRLRTVAPTDATVLVQGESGTGKERIARAIHSLSPRAKGPFVAISCAALPETLLESELFGHEKGAFTDARKERRGRFEMAHGGTFFLDDIDDMPLALQVKLLRVLQEREIERLGAEAPVEVDIRVVAATKVPLRLRVSEGRFREDLFYRLDVVRLVLPPLRERTGDVPLLAQHFLARQAAGRALSIPRAAMAALERYPWPGNVRELEHAVLRAVSLSGERTELALEDLLPDDPRWKSLAESAVREANEGVRPLREVLHERERTEIQRALAATGGARMKAAELLGISRKVLWEKIKEHGLGEEGEAEAQA